jgi:hypothetical protein
MSLEEWADLHGEDYPKGKFFSALDYGCGDRTSMTIYCDYCEQSFEIKEDEFEDWIIVDPESGDKAVMCGECWSRRTQRAPTDGGLCAVCGYPEYNHSAIGHEFDPAISG